MNTFENEDMPKVAFELQNSCSIPPALDFIGEPEPGSVVGDSKGLLRLLRGTRFKLVGVFRAKTAASYDRRSSPLSWRVLRLCEVVPFA